MKKKINKQKIVKYVGAGLLTATLVSGVGLSVYDANVDHTKDICLICDCFSQSSLLKDLGIAHQMEKMESKYNSAGYDVSVIYNPSHQDERYITEKVLAIAKNNEDGTIEYAAPVGYKKAIIDGKYYAVKTIISKSPSYEAFETYFSDNVMESKVLKLK